MSERILVVEDDDQISAIVRDGLTRMGYHVELAADGPAALAAVRTQPFDQVQPRFLRIGAWQIAVRHPAKRQCVKQPMRSAHTMRSLGASPSDREGG